MTYDSQEVHDAKNGNMRAALRSAIDKQQNVYSELNQEVEHAKKEHGENWEFHETILAYMWTDAMDVLEFLNHLLQNNADTQRYSDEQDQWEAQNYG